MQMQLENNDTLFVVPIADTVIFPHTVTKLQVEAVLGEKLKEIIGTRHPFALALSLKKNRESGEYAREDFYQIGTLLSVRSVKASDAGFLAEIEAQDKAEVVNITIESGLITGNFVKLHDETDFDKESQQEMVEYIRKSVSEVAEKLPGTRQYVKGVLRSDSVIEIMGAIVPYLPVPLAEKQELLEIASLRKKSLRFIDMLTHQNDSLSLKMEMAKIVNNRTNENYRKNLLREQLKAIQDELNAEDPEGQSEPKTYREKIELCDMPEDVRKTALDEARKFDAMEKNNPERYMLQNYLDLLVALPWRTRKIADIDIERARRILDEQHYGLKKVKERIIQHLAVMKLKNEKQGSILLLVGPPGTGKTSLGRSIAEALERQYVRMSLGGIRDEAEIRGHRRTYIGALPGRIIQGMKKAGEKNPVFVLDEIDKTSPSYNGDPASALLEVLDPEQNNTFADHYLEVPYDLSDVLFIATANSLSTIPAPLLDRTEVIEINGYTNHEKLRIGVDHLLPAVLGDHGLDASRLRITEGAMEGIIEKYTREAGVRGLKKQLARVARVVSEKIVSGGIDLPYVVEDSLLEEILGRETIRLDAVDQESVPGVVTGMAWTPVGGDILFIEGTFMAGKGGLTLTGQLGDVMKESATIALSLIRSRLTHALTAFDFTTNDIHVHVPSGAVQKDGPSAGVAMVTALASLILGKRVDPHVAMTGEITLRGTVLPVGGIKEKVIAAHRAGVRRVILPAENLKDLEEIPEEVRDDLDFLPVKTVEEVLRSALDLEVPRPEALPDAVGSARLRQARRD